MPRPRSRSRQGCTSTVGGRASSGAACRLQLLSEHPEDAARDLSFQRLALPRLQELPQRRRALAEGIRAAVARTPSGRCALGPGRGGVRGRGLLRRRRRRLLEPRRQHLPRALRVDPLAVLREQRRRVRRTRDVVGGRHPRRRSPQLGVHDRRGHAVLRQDRDGGLTDAELRQQLTEVVELRLRERRHRRLQRLCVVRGERPQRVLHAVAQLGEYVARNILRRLRDEEHANALRPNQPHRLRDAVEERLARTVEQEVRFVEEEDELRLVEVTHLGKLLEKLREQPHQRGREQLRFVLHRRKLQAGDQPAPVGRRTQQVGDVELRLAEELGASAVLETDQRTQEHTHRLRRQTADAGELCLAVVGVEEGQQRAQVGKIEQRQTLVIGVAEDEPQRLLLGLVGLEHFREQLRAEVGDRGPHRHSRADPAEGEELHRKGRRREIDSELGVPLGARAVHRPGAGHPGHIAFHIGDEDTDSCRRHHLDHDLQRLRLPGPRRPGDEPVPVHHRQRDLDHGVLRDRALVHAAPEVNSGAAGLVRVGHRPREVSHAHDPSQQPPSGRLARVTDAFANAEIRDLTLPAGRTLRTYAAGAKDGELIVMHHGTPASGCPSGWMADDAAARGAWLVGYDRPGYGGSTRQPGRSVADAAADTAAVADAYGADRFRTWGISGGGPHALACAALLLDRVISAASLASVAPYDADGLDFLAGMGDENVEEFGAAVAGEEPLRPMLEAMRTEVLGTTPESVADQMRSLLPPVDVAVITGDFAVYLHGSMTAGQQPGYEGWLDDDLAFVSDWGFRPEDIGVPTLLRQGRQDLMVPFAHGEWLAARVPAAEARLTEDDGHLTLIADLGPIHDWLLRQT